MSPAVYVLSLFGFLLMFALPRIFFRADGKMNLRWWLTGSPFGLAASGVWMTWAGISPQLVSASTPAGAVLDTIGVLVTVGAYVMIAATIAIHRVPLALWHQEGDKN